MAETDRKTNKIHNCWETILPGSLTFSHILWSRVLTAFVLGYFLKDVYTVKKLEKYSLLFQSKVRFSYSFGYSDTDSDRL